jgi:hypothetical protein
MERIEHSLSCVTNPFFTVSVALLHFCVIYIYHTKFDFRKGISITAEPDTMIGIVPGPRAGPSGVPVPAQATYVSFLQNVQTGPGPLEASYSMRTWGPTRW